MTDTVDTSKEAVERLAGDCKLAEKVMRERNTFSTGQGILSDAAASLVALAAERDQLRREVEEARDRALDEAASLMGTAAENCRQNFTYPPKTQEQRDYQTGAILHSNAAKAIRAIKGRP